MQMFHKLLYAFLKQEAMLARSLGSFSNSDKVYIAAQHEHSRTVTRHHESQNLIV